ncbi:MAG TPA: DUF4440 domain-containing protein [Allosphingosinicella sp.]|jgi:hypothetical protein
MRVAARAAPFLIAAMIGASPANADPAADATAGVNQQVAAWNRGDLEGALDGYCPRPDISWVNRQGLSRGFADFATGMRSDFADRGRMGAYQAQILQSRTVGRRSALVVVRWSISRDGNRIMGGISTQLWEHCGGKLRITLEHAS